MYLRDIAVYGDEAIVTDFPSGFVGWFHRETCCITDLYASLLRKKVKTPDTTKVNLVFVQQHDGFAPNVRQLLRAADAKWPFRLLEYSQMDAGSKKRMILDALQASLLWIAKEMQWDARGLEECHATVINRNLEFEGWSRKSWLSPNPEYRARVGFSFGLRSVDFFVGIFDRRRIEIGRKPLASVAPEMWMAHLVLKGEGKWIRGRVFRFQTGRQFFQLPKFWEADMSDLLIERAKRSR